MIVKGARKSSFRTMWRTSTVFKILVASLPVTLAVLVSHVFAHTLAVSVAPFVLIWKSTLLFVFVRRRRLLAELDPLSARERNDTNKKFHYLRTWWNYVILIILMTAYCGMIAYNAATRWAKPVGPIVQTVLLGLDTVAIAALIFSIARLHKRAREEARLRTKAIEAGEVDNGSEDGEESVDGDASVVSVDTPPPAYSNNGRAPPQVVCMMCATHIPHGEKVLIQPSLR
ncbi:hypothetical protein AURDEDRAFT_111318 [Auricularia subglabra TFB-10046 SS5]|nr:hypothetical protein AURDEDRAFT_111318 [Auricularia subglabra TFB-10046 SS5]